MRARPRFSRPFRNFMMTDDRQPTTQSLALPRRILRLHAPFLLLLFLFVSFRLLALLLLRPGGFLADASDVDFYYTWGLLMSMGYRTFDTLWTAYPPLFPQLMLSIFEWSSRVPPWVEPRLAFHTLFGAIILLFDAGNLALLYSLANQLSHEQKGTSSPRPNLQSPISNLQSPLLPPLLYALLFTPLYTALGWFEAMPLFFMLLGLDLLLRRPAPSPFAVEEKALGGATEEFSTVVPLAVPPLSEGRLGGGWLFSAVAVALGFLIKLTPLLLLPIAVRWLGARLSWRAARREWFDRRAPGNLLRPTLYALIVLLVTVAIGYPIVRANPALALSSFQVQGVRAPWQSVWALLDGVYGAGVVQADMRNLIGLARDPWQSTLPWTWITLAFVLLYTWLYTRPFDWTRRRTPVAFAAVSVLWLFLYSKGWSPQFLLWVLAFVALLLPTARGAVIGAALAAINVIESQIFLLLLPGERWILWTTVLARTLLLVLLAVEFLAQIWPRVTVARPLKRIAAGATWLVLAATVVTLAIGAPSAARAYADRRLAEHPCREAIALLRDEEGETRQIITGQTAVWRDLYPWLRDDYAITVIDTYSPIDEARETVAARRFHELLDEAGATEFWWIEQPGSLSILNDDSSDALRPLLASNAVTRFDDEQFGACRLLRAARLGGAPLAAAATAGGPIELIDAALPQSDARTLQSGGEVNLVLYWRARSSVEESYTVFAQLFAAGADSQVLIAQQDNLPVRGLAPTTSWQPGSVIRDPYNIALPEDADVDDSGLTLHVGLYTEAGRVPLRLADGTIVDHLTFEVQLE